MNFLEFIRDFVPEYLGVHPDNGTTSELVLRDEIKGEHYKAESYKNIWERARMLLPYLTWRWIRWLRVMKVIVLAICIHRIKKPHNEDHIKKIEKLKKTYLLRKNVIDIGVLDWWNP